MRRALLVGACATFAGAIFTGVQFSKYNAIRKAQVDADFAAGKIITVSGTVTRCETKLNDKFLNIQGERVHVVSIVEYKDQSGARHTIRSHKERFESEQVDVSFYPAMPAEGWVKKDGVRDNRADALLLGAVLLGLTSVGCAVVCAAAPKDA